MLKKENIIYNNLYYSALYAFIKDLYIGKRFGHAIFLVQIEKDRKGNKIAANIVDKKEISFKVNRNESPYITAYRTAKESHDIKTFVIENGKQVEKIIKTIKMPFYDWDDDIEEETENGNDN